MLQRHRPLFSANAFLIVTACVLLAVSTPSALGSGEDTPPTAPAAAAAPFEPAAPSEPAAPVPSSTQGKPAKPAKPEESAIVAQAQALADVGKFAEAEAIAREGLKAAGNPPSAELHNILGYALRNQKKWKPAVAAYKQALELKPDFAQAKEYLAIAYLHLKDIKAAKALQTDLAKSRPDLASMIDAEAKRLKVKW